MVVNHHLASEVLIIGDPAGIDFDGMDDSAEALLASTLTF